MVNGMEMIGGKLQKRSIASLRSVRLRARGSGIAVMALSCHMVRYVRKKGYYKLDVGEQETVAYEDEVIGTLYNMESLLDIWFIIK
jgi:hypothetical protein